MKNLDILLFHLISFLVFQVVGSVEKASEEDASTKTRIGQVLGQVLSWQKLHKHEFPFVTLTFAQSLDGKIALYLDGADENETSSNLPISGPESLLMTHALRSVHDAILVGGRTLYIDNPRLSNRLWEESHHQPRPVILDTNLRYIRALGESCRAKNLIVCCSAESASRSEDIPKSIHLLPCRVLEDGTMDVSHVLVKLRKSFGISSVMVEGGARILSTFARHRLVNCLCVTISSKLLGDRGLPAFLSLRDEENRSHLGRALPDLHFPTFVPLGNDCILLSKWWE